MYFCSSIFHIVQEYHDDPDIDATLNEVTWAYDSSGSPTVNVDVTRAKQKAGTARATKRKTRKRKAKSNIEHQYQESENKPLSKLRRRIRRSPKKEASDIKASSTQMMRRGEIKTFGGQQKLKSESRGSFNAKENPPQPIRTDSSLYKTDSWIWFGGPTR